MVGTCKIHAETRAHVVNNEHNAVVVAKLAHLLPIALVREEVVVEIAVHIRLGNQAGDFALIIGE